jgi:signal transduction histidine kinase
MWGFATRWDPVTGQRVVSVARMVDAVRAFGLIAVIVSVSLADPGPGTPGSRGVLIAITLALSSAGWIAWLVSGTTGQRRGLSLGSLIVMAGAGGVLAGLTPSSPAIAVVCAAAFSSGVRLNTGASVGIMAGGTAALVLTALLANQPTGVVLGFPFAIAGLWSVAMTRREYLVRAEQAERTLAETRRAREAENQAAALAERARIARDIHDVLAHSLAAVSVNLQAAGGLLAADTLPQDNPELTKAIECVERAGTLTREGLAQARRAILALRDDAAPLPDQLASLAAQFQAAGDAVINLAITGEPRPLSAQAVQVAYRTAQEGLTNARKHAPGAAVTLAVEAGGDELRVEVRSLAPVAVGSGPALPGTGTGLIGLAERVALAGGELESGVDPAGAFVLRARLPR